ncbi:hypothetical protein EIN_470090, partial [Entamoeba invadens IP1]
VDVFLEEENTESWRVDAFKVSVVSNSSKPDGKTRDILNEQNDILENYMKTTKLVYFTRINLYNIEGQKTVLAKKLKECSTIRAKIPKNWEKVSVLSESELASRIRIIQNGVELNENTKTITSNEVILKIGDEAKRSGLSFKKEGLKELNNTHKKLEEKLIKTILKNSESVAFSGWNLYASLFDFINEETNLVQAMGTLCSGEYNTKSVENSIFSSLVFLYKNIEEEDVFSSVDLAFWKFLEYVFVLLRNEVIEVFVKNILVEQFAKVMWGVFRQNKELRTNANLDKYTEKENSEFIEELLKTWREDDKAPTITMHCTVCLFESILFIGLINGKCENRFNSSFIELLNSMKTREDCDDFLEILEWYNESENLQGTSEVMEQLYSDCFEYDKKAKGFGYYFMMSRIIPKCFQLKGLKCAEKMKEFCEREVDKVIHLINTNSKIDEIDNLDGTLEVCLAIIKSQHFDNGKNIFLEKDFPVFFVKLLEVYLFPILVVKDGNETFPRCKTENSRQLCFDFVLELAKIGDLGNFLVTWTSRYISFFAKKEFKFCTPSLVGNKVVIDALLIFSGVVSPQFMTKTTDGDLKIILREIQTILSKIQNEQECEISTKNLENMLEKYDEKCSDHLHIIKTVFGLLRQIGWDDGLVLEDQTLDDIFDHTENQRAKYVVVSSNRILQFKEKIDIFNSQNKDYEYILNGEIGESTWFKLGTEWFKTSPLVSSERVTVEKVRDFGKKYERSEKSFENLSHLDTSELSQTPQIFLYKMSPKCAVIPQRFSSFHNEIFLFSRSFQDFAFSVAKTSTLSLSIKFSLFYMQTVLFRNPNLPNYEAWAAYFDEIYDKVTFCSDWIFHYFTPEVLTLFFSRNYQISNVIFKMLKKVLSDKMAERSDYDYERLSEIATFAERCIVSVEKSPRESIVDLFEFFAVNSFKEMEFVVLKKNIFWRIVKILKNGGMKYINDKTAAALLRCFYTLYVNSDVNDNAKKSNKQLVKLSSDDFMDDVEFLYAISKYEVSTLFLEEFVRITFLGKPERIVNFLTFFTQNVGEISTSQFLFLKYLFKVNERFEGEMAKIMVKPVKSLIAKCENVGEVVSLLNNVIVLSEISQSVFMYLKGISKFVNEKISNYGIKIAFL